MSRGLEVGVMGIRYAHFVQGAWQESLDTRWRYAIGDRLHKLPSAVLY